jgi:glycyl-tRNA synthetase
MARTYLFLKSVGISEEGIRFRQHRSDEMAHYAADCWDAEVETSYGWIEIAGHADRSCYDLSRHAKRTKTELVAARLLPEPKLVKYVKILPNKKEIGKIFKGDSKPINDTLEELSEEEKQHLMQEFEAYGEATVTLQGGKQIKLNKDFIAFEQCERTQHEEKYTPSVIEPSFGNTIIFVSLALYFRNWKNCVLHLRALLQDQTPGSFPHLLHLPSPDCTLEVLDPSIDPQQGAQ